MTCIWKTKQKEKSFGKLKDCAGKVIYNMDQLWMHLYNCFNVNTEH